MSVFHALVLNFHQPSGNLEHLLFHNEWEAKEILWSLDRIPRVLWGYEDIARIHLSFSGTLLETLAGPDFQRRVYGTVKCGDVLWFYQNHKLFQILGTGYYHPVLPLIPEEDRKEQVSRWLSIARHLFWRTGFSGFWPPEMGFSMDMIPLIRGMGFRYVLVDSEHVEPVEPMRWEEIRYKPHLAKYGNDEIIVIVRDRELSDAQESGMDFGWFSNEIRERTKWCDFPPLVTTCTDGDNGGWFRNTDRKSNFWNLFYIEMLNKIRDNGTDIRPTFISDYLDRYGVTDYVNVNTGAWNTGWHNGKGFIQWTGSQAQKDALARIADVSGRFHRVGTAGNPSSDLDNAHWHLLRAQTSCNFYWGEAWVHKCHEDLNEVERFLNNITVHP